MCVEASYSCVLVEKEDRVDQSAIDFLSLLAILYSLSTYVFSHSSDTSQEIVRERWKSFPGSQNNVVGIIMQGNYFLPGIFYTHTCDKRTHANNIFALSSSTKKRDNFIFYCCCLLLVVLCPLSLSLFWLFFFSCGKTERIATEHPGRQAAQAAFIQIYAYIRTCLLYTSPSPRDQA